MRNYSDDPASCRVDFFKPSGKWYATEAIVFTEDDWSLAPSLALWRALERQLGGRMGGMLAVCLEPYTERSFPTMVPVPVDGFEGEGAQLGPGEGCA